MFVEFIKNLGVYFASINANAFYSILYMLSKNLLMIFAIIFIVVLALVEMKDKSNETIDDRRNIY